MRRHTLAALVLAPVLALSLTACGDDGLNAATGKTSAKPTGEFERALAFAKCMRGQGIEMEDPQREGNGAITQKLGGNAEDAGKMKAAQAKCRHLMPNGGQPRKLSPGDLAKMRQHAKCVREHGIDMPDPDDSGRIIARRSTKPGGGGKVEEGPDPESQEFKEADQACRKYLPKRPESGNGN